MRTNHISRREVILTTAIVILLFEVTACTSDVIESTSVQNSTPASSCNTESSYSPYVVNREYPLEIPISELPAIYDFYTSTPELNVGEDVDTIYFYLISGLDMDKIDVTDETGSVVTSLYDNGNYQNNGDSEISDGYYTGILHVDTDVASEHTYAILIEYDDQVYSASTTLSIFPTFTELNNDELNSIMIPIRELKESDDYRSLDDSERAEAILDILYGIADNGTEDYGYSLIDSESIHYYADCRYVEFTTYFDCPVIIDLYSADELYDMGIA